MTRLAEAEIAHAHETSVRLEIHDVVKVLQEILGTRLVGHLAGSKDPKAVSDWIEGSRAPRAAAESRLRTALQAVQVLQAVESEHVVQAWFIGQNPQLDDDAPATALSADRLKDVLGAARAFAQTG
ncbi:MAG: XRE family transcriptional regulator [Actinomycetota bacterium]|nr:XRE family transcriptional regulator [Actinomycetota bacterium]